MADSNTRITNIVGKSFNELKQRHIEYISGSDEFSDYRFAGSRLNVLMSAVTFSTYYMQSYANFALRESYLQTCRRLESGIIAAQEQGYVPRGVRGAVDEIEVVVTDALDRDFVTMPRGTVFSGSINDDTYLFTSVADRTSERLTNDTYRLTIPIVQGNLVSRFRTYTESVNEFVLRDDRADTSTMRVLVNGQEWTFVDSSIGTRPSSEVWYLRYTEEKFPVIYFGTGSVTNEEESGIGGIKPIIGSEVEIEYIRSTGERANGADGYEDVSSFDNLEFIQIIQNPDANPDYTGAYGGAEFQTLEALRSNVFIFRDAQRRCVTPVDYESIITRQFGNFIGSIRVTGRADNPGYAFINIKPLQGFNLSPSIKSDIEDYVAGLNVVTVEPVIADPTYMFVKKVVDVDYDLNLGAGDEGTIRRDVVAGIDSYYTTEVENFGQSFHTSRMLSYVDSANDAVLGSSATLELVREFDGIVTDVVRDSFFGNQIVPSSFETSTFIFESDELDISLQPETYEVYVRDDGAGQLLIGPFGVNENISVPITEITEDGNWYAIGQIDYISSSYVFAFDALGIASTRFIVGAYTTTVKPLYSDIYADQGVIIVFDSTLRPEYLDIDFYPIVLRG